MKPLFLLVFLLLDPLAASSQNTKIDSLRRVIETTKVDPVWERTLCRLCEQFEQVGKYDEGLAAGEQGLEIKPHECIFSFLVFSYPHSLIYLK